MQQLPSINDSRVAPPVLVWLPSPFLVKNGQNLDLQHVSALSAKSPEPEQFGPSFSHHYFSQMTTLEHRPIYCKMIHALLSPCQLDSSPTFTATNGHYFGNQHKHHNFLEGVKGGLSTLLSH